MNVYLVQHGDSQPKDVDTERSLSERGRRETEAVAAYAARLGIDVHQIRHSGKTRAEQTAAILADALGPVGGVQQSAGLAPLDDVATTAEALSAEEIPVMLVGHLPFMARLTGLLIAKDPEREVVRFRNSAVITLLRTEAGWQLDWILTPDMAAAR